MRLPSITLRGTLAILVWCALLVGVYLMLGRESLHLVLIYTTGPIVVAVLERCWGGRGMYGGVFGGMVSYIGLFLSMFLWAHFHPRPGDRDRWGVDTQCIRYALCGAAVGLAIGAFIWVVMGMDRAWERDSESVVEPDEGFDVSGLLAFTGKGAAPEMPGSERGHDEADNVKA
jgi:hypothetical protein